MTNDSSGSNLHNDPDATDISLALSGDGKAYAQVIQRHQAEIASRMWRFTRDRAEHEVLVQDVFVEAYLGLRNFRGEAPFSHWLARIATNVGYKFWRDRSRTASNNYVSIDEWAKAATVDPEDLEAAQAAEILHSILGRLPPRDRLILTLRYVEDLSVEETAERIGWTGTMVKVQSWRARQKLKKLLKKAGLEVE
jgi:RNA polymerase sigma-70 factor, ECF subfamily